MEPKILHGVSASVGLQNPIFRLLVCALVKILCSPSPGQKTMEREVKQETDDVLLQNGA